MLSQKPLLCLLNNKINDLYNFTCSPNALHVCIGLDMQEVCLTCRIFVSRIEYLSNMQNICPTCVLFLTCKKFVSNVEYLSHVQNIFPHVEYLSNMYSICPTCVLVLTCMKFVSLTCCFYMQKFCPRCSNLHEGPEFYIR